MGIMEMANWILAALSIALGFLFGVSGMVAAQKGTASLAQNGSVLVAYLWLVMGALFGLTAWGMHQGSRWRWLAQITPAVTYIVGVMVMVCFVGHGQLTLFIGQPFVDATVRAFEQQGILAHCHRFFHWFTGNAGS